MLKLWQKANKALFTFISNVEFLLMLQIWLEILTEVKSVSEYLQRESIDLVNASDIIKSTLKCLKDKRTDKHFQELLDAAEQIADREDVTKEFKVPRTRRRKQMPGEMAHDELVVKPADRFCINILNRIYDALTGKLKTRFADFHEVVKKFGCLMPPNIGKLDDFKVLAEVHSMDVDKDLLIAEYEQLFSSLKIAKYLQIQSQTQSETRY